jgi:hypothetical protein
VKIGRAHIWRLGKPLGQAVIAMDLAQVIGFGQTKKWKDRFSERSLSKVKKI